ncbi:hypothetical protein FH972_026652 [Carpinus fangiana]|uniref:ATP-dependent DNA helicase II subunit 1 n=1 Tax=Carpinus fangiana TaxID=176857 RepID=A0A5N6L4Q5_9ROSI|nr:hypothetical protein FH972_026652 [Carpinus fangiana]
MLQRPPPSDRKKADHDAATSAALKCAYTLMQQRIISNPKDMMGILLFGTRDSKFHEDDPRSSGAFLYPHCYLLSDLDVPAAEDVKRLRAVVEDEQESHKLLVPSDEPVAMSNVLFCANQIFTTKAPNFSSRRLFLVTDNDNPHGQSKELRSSAIVRAKDLYDLGVTIELFPISQPGQTFDRAKFYDDIIYRASPDSDAPTPVSFAVRASTSDDGISLLQSLLSAIQSKSAPKRALFSLPLELSPDFRISVKGYILFKRQEPARSTYIWLDGETPQIVTATTTRLAENTAHPIENLEVKKAFKFGGENVLFAPEELKALRSSFGDPVIRVIGFKKRSLLPIWANLRPATFIYPSDEDYIGSTRTFSALHQSLLAKDKMAIVWYVARRNAAPVIAALLPGHEELGEMGEQQMPAGLWIVPIPFADDIRANPDMPTNLSAPDVLKDKMRLVVQQLQLPKAVYDPARYPNPALQWHYKILKALALEEDLPEEATDMTVPKYKQIDKRAGPYVLDWGKELELEYQKYSREQGHSGKRPAVSAPGDTSGDTKKVKKEDGVSDASISDDHVKSLFTKGKLASLKVQELKEWLIGKSALEKGRGMKKDDLISMIEAYWERKG